MPNPIIKIQFTPEKYAQMQQDWRRLTEERKAVMLRLKDAREMGDLSENGAYKYAKFELGSINRQLRQLRHLLENGEVLVKPPATGKIELGSTVKLKFADQEVSYTLVNQYESDPNQGKLSFESPLGSLLVGKKIGQTISLVVPSGINKYLIESIT